MFRPMNPLWTDFRQRLPEGWKSTVRIRHGLAAPSSFQVHRKASGEMSSPPPQPTAHGEDEPGRILRSAPLLVDAESDEDDLSQLRF